MENQSLKLTDFEREALQRFLADGGLVLSAIKKFLENRVRDLQSNSSDALLANPRQLDLAADYSAKAAACKDFIGELDRFSKR
jgi:hypothetical protein